jgi:cadmium resistance protein CadD (predicted permease)
MNWLIILITFMGCNLDFFFILLLLLRKLALKWVIVGYLLGLWILLAISFFAGHLLERFFAEWMLGFLGILPIYMALHDNDGEAQQVPTSSPIITTLVTYLSVCAGCNLAIFLPVLTPVKLRDFGLILMVLSVLSVVIILGIQRLSDSGLVNRIMDHYGEIMIKVVYIGVGLYVFWDSGLIRHLLSWILSKGVTSHY